MLIVTFVTSTSVRGVSPSTGTASIAFTTSMPAVTLPKAANFRSSCLQSPVQTKNEVCALPGSSPCAIETMPATCGVSLNSGARLWTSRCWLAVSGALRYASAPVWITKFETTRWMRVLS